MKENNHPTEQDMQHPLSAAVERTGQLLVAWIGCGVGRSMGTILCHQFWDLDDRDRLELQRFGIYRFE